MATADLCIRNVRIPGVADGTAPTPENPGHSPVHDLWIDSRRGRITAIIAPGSVAPGEGTTIVEQDGGLVLPAAVDVHTHLDKYGIWERSPNPEGDFSGALTAARADSKHQDEADLLRRMSFALRVAYAQGTVAVRSHLDASPDRMAAKWALADRLRADWSGRIDLQFVHLSDITCFADRETARRELRIVADYGGLLGGVVRDQADLEPLLERLFTLADEFGLDVDLHVDETLEAGVRGVDAVLHAMRSTGFRRTLALGHCCALSTLSEGALGDTARRLRDDGVGVISLPVINEYLQDRKPTRTPRHRGIPPLRELRDRGVDVAVASDNCRDPFYPFGDFNLIEVLANTVRIAHLELDLDAVARHVTTVPAAMMGLSGKGGVAVGADADLLLFRGRTMTEILARPDPAHRRLMRGGRMVDVPLPDFRDLG